MKLYHGTSPEQAEAILREGISFAAPRRRDPGDFGWGFYLTTSKVRARAYGAAILEFVVNREMLAHIANPYFLQGFDQLLPETYLERLFYGMVFDERGGMGTVHGRGSSEFHAEQREAVARAVRREFQSQGYHGIRTSLEDEETVLFSRDPVVSVRHVGA